MNKLIIGSLVGGLILFIWQFLSWAALNLHGDSTQYTAKQDTIMQLLNTELEPGYYFLPSVPKGTSPEEQQAKMKESEGKPWAQIYYHESMDTNMTMNMVRGFIVDVVIALLICWLLAQIRSRTFKDTVMICLAVGLVVFLAGVYGSAIWFETPTMPDLVDAIVSFGLLGVWLGYYLKD